MPHQRLDNLRTRRELGGVSVAELAKRANLTDEEVQRLESRGTCDPPLVTRILNALAPPVSITSNSQANPSVVTTSAAHTYQTGDTVVIAGVAGSNADVNGTRVVTRLSSTTFSVPVDATIAGGTGGTATATTATLGLVSLA